MILSIYQFIARVLCPEQLYEESYPSPRVQNRRLAKKVMVWIVLIDPVLSQKNNCQLILKRSKAKKQFTSIGGMLCMLTWYNDFLNNSSITLNAHNQINLQVQGVH